MDGVRTFRFGTSPKIHAAKEIREGDPPQVPLHLRLWCGMSGTERQFRLSETDRDVTCKSCLRALSARV